MKVINAGTLRAVAVQGSAPAILDVRLADDHAAGHIPGSVNNCVFEVAFDERMPGVAPDKSAPLVVAGSRDGSHEATMAAEKLVRLGYRDVRVLDGGLSGWIAAGGAVEGTSEFPREPEIRDGTFDIDLEASRIGWRGRNILNSHHGSIGLKSGTITVAGGLPVDGAFILDMTTIRCDDLAGNRLHDVLIAHLHSHDFFDVAYHPEARLEITQAETIGSALHGLPNMRFHTNLTLRGVAAPLVIDAVTGITVEGQLAAQCAFAFDRTLWKIIYGSARFFHRLGGHLVNDLIEIDLKVVTRTEAGNAGSPKE